MIALARLVKLATDDGLMEIGDGVELGKQYLVDLQTVADVKCFNIDKGVFHIKRMVQALEISEDGHHCSARPFALELLEIIVNDGKQKEG